MANIKANPKTAKHKATWMEVGEMHIVSTRTVWLLYGQNN